MNPYFVPSMVAVGLGILVEALFKPRLDFTHNNDVILWYYNKKRERVFMILFHFH